MKYFISMTGRFMLPATLLFFLLLLVQRANAKDYLLRCRNKQAKIVQGQYLNISYKESSHVLVHGMEPWRQGSNITTGSIWCNAACFLKKDTLQGSNPYYSTTQMADSTLLLYNYGAKELSAVTRDAFLDYTFETSRYSPVKLLNYFTDHAPSRDTRNNDTFAVYTLTINKTIVQLFIRKKTSLLEKVVTMANDDMLGDIANTCTYKSYTITGSLYFPGTILMEKVNGRLLDSITITSAKLVSSAPVVDKPVIYRLKETSAATPVVNVQKYNEHLYFMELKHTESQAAIVVFRDFILVADVPLSSDNGELVLTEIRKMWPDKPVRYFAFGHHHPWSLGGLRPFVHNGTTVLTVNGDIPYLQYLVTAPHTLKPDSLQLQPKPLITDTIGIQKTITDGDYTMEIRFIGDKSAHTKDYLLFYFPAEKLLFEGDLTWIA